MESRDNAVAARTIVTEQTTLLMQRAAAWEAEVGEIAKAAEVFRTSGLEAIQMRAEQEKAGALAAERQKAALNQMADDFENAVQQASQGAGEVTSNIVGVTQAAQEASSASAQVLSSASELAQQSEILRSRMAEFLQTVRAA